MKLPFPSEEWAKQLQVELNQSQNYAEAAATWEGDFYFIVDPGQGVVKEEVMYLDLWHGKCREAGMLADRTVRPQNLSLPRRWPRGNRSSAAKLTPFRPWSRAS